MTVCVDLHVRDELHRVGVQSSDGATSRVTFPASLLMTAGDGQPYSDITSCVAGASLGRKQWHSEGGGLHVRGGRTECKMFIWSTLLFAFMPINDHD